MIDKKAQETTAETRKLVLEKTDIKNLTIQSGVRAGARCQNTCFNCGRSSLLGRP